MYCVRCNAQEPSDGIAARHSPSRANLEGEIGTLFQRPVVTLLQSPERLNHLHLCISQCSFCRTKLLLPGESGSLQVTSWTEMSGLP